MVRPEAACSWTRTAVRYRQQLPKCGTGGIPLAQPAPPPRTHGGWLVVKLTLLETGLVTLAAVSATHDTLRRGQGFTRSASTIHQPCQNKASLTA